MTNTPIRQTFKSLYFIINMTVFIYLRIGEHSYNILLKGFTVENCRRYGINGWKVKNIVLDSMEIKNTGWNFYNAVLDLIEIMNIY